MTLTSLIVMIVCTSIVLTFSFAIFTGGKRNTVMSVEKCNIKYCEICSDREQCFYKREDLE